LRLARLAGALGSFWQEHAHYGEGRRWLAAALALGGEAPPQDRLRLLTGAGALAWYQSDVTAARAMHEQALALAQEIGDRAAEAFELGNLGAHAAELGQYELATERFEASLAVAREVGNPRPVVLALHNLAHQDWARGEFARASQRLEEALALARAHRMGWALPFLLVGLGMTALDCGEPAPAVAYFQESLALAQVRGNLGDVIEAIEGLARVAVATDRAALAVRLFGATDALREELTMPFTSSEADLFATIERQGERSLKRRRWLPRVACVPTRSRRTRLTRARTSCMV
jgi:tetratricopeptide (TPR) repeat protein